MKETVYFGTYTRRTSQRDLQGRLWIQKLVSFQI